MAPISSPLLTLFCALKPYRIRVICAFSFLFLAVVSTLGIPIVIRGVIDHGFVSEAPWAIQKYFLIFLGMIGLLAFSSASRYYHVTWLGERLVSDLRSRLFQHLLTLGLDFYEMAQTGDLVSRLSADTTQIKSLFGSTLSLALRNLLLGGGAVGMMFFTSPKLSILVLGTVPIILLPLVLFSRRVRALSRRSQESLGDANAFLQESLSHIDMIQAAAQEKNVSQIFQIRTLEAFQSQADRIKARAILTASIIAITGGSLLGVLWFGASDVISMKMSAGTLTQFIVASALAAGSLAALSEIWGDIQLASGAAERLFELLKTSPSLHVPSAPTFLSHKPHRISFSDVNFSYPSRPDVAILKNLSLTLEAEEKVAFVGPSGSGKTTLFKLLLRFYDPISGEIRLGEHPLPSFSLSDLRRFMAWVPQDPKIFSATLEENIRFSAPDASEEAFRKACESAHLDEFVREWPMGYSTRLGERGQTLSGGQKQRVAIARAILQEAPLLLLDEATSALDSHNEAMIHSALDVLTKNRTTLIIAHRLATVQKADRIVVLEKGRIEAMGIHETLLQKGGLYKTFVDLQFGQPLREDHRAILL